ncbi:hypothetical protein JCM19000A_33860 [Silvimonas sp. JCM 19000]
MTRWSKAYRRDNGYELRECLRVDESGIGRFAGLYLFQHNREVGGPYASLQRGDAAIVLHAATLSSMAMNANVMNDAAVGQAC